MTHVGFHYTIQWGSPYSDPRGGLPRIKAEMYETLEQRERRRENGDGYGVPSAFSALHTIGDGYSVYITSVCTPTKRYSKETLAVVRKKRLSRRITKKYPLFADQLIVDEIYKKPEYYAGETDAKIKADCDQAIAWEEEVYRKFLEGVKNGEIYIYAVPQEVL